MIVKNVAYMFALAASLLTVSGFMGCGNDKRADDSAEHKSMAANEVTTEASTVVASAEVAEQTATEQKVEEASVATAEAATTMPMNEEKAA